MCGSMADIQSAAAEIRRGKKRRRTNHSMKIYMVCPIAYGDHKTGILKENCQLLSISHRSIMGQYAWEAVSFSEAMKLNLVIKN